MKGFNKIIVMLFMLFSLFALPFIIYYSTEQTVITQCSSAEICIASDLDFLLYDFQGKGTEAEPYIIEDMNFKNNTIKPILIRNTSVFFIIRNCSFENLFDSYQITINGVRDGTAKIFDNLFNGTYCLEAESADSIIVQGNSFFSFYVGLRMENCSNIKVSDNYFSSMIYYIFGFGPSSNGIIFSDSEKVLVTRNQFHDLNHGIRVFSTSGVSIFDNIIINVVGGIWTDFCGEVDIKRNNVSAGWIGIWIMNSPFSVVEQNNCTGGYYGIYPNESPNTIVRRNNLTNTGIYLYTSSHSDYETYTFEDNYVNNRPFGYFLNLNNVTFKEQIYGQLFFVFCDNLRLENQYICNTSIGVYAMYCSNISIEESTFQYNNYGIRIRSSNLISIRNNIIKSFIAAIDISSVFIMNIANNSLSYSNYGVIASNSYFSNITRNFLFKNDLGVFLSLGCEYFEVTYNIFLNHTDFAIDIHGDLNLIHHNSFYFNYEIDGSQGYDSGDGNYWYDTTTNEGNWWSNWSGNGSYPIYGKAGSKDFYPLSTPPT